GCKACRCPRLGCCTRSSSSAAAATATENLESESPRSAMPRVFIPPLMRSLTDGAEQVEGPGANVRQIVANLEARHPGIRERLCEGDVLKPGLAVAVDGNVTSLGLLQKVQEASEVHFLPAIGGG